MRKAALLTLVLFVLSPLSSIASMSEMIVFKANKDKLVEYYTLFNKLNRLKRPHTNLDLVYEGADKKQEAKKLVNVLKKGIKNPKKFTRSNKEAKKIKFDIKLKSLEGYLARFDKLFGEYLKDRKSGAESGKANDVFNDNKEFVIEADKVLKKFTSNRTSTDDAIAMLDEAQNAVDYGSVAIKNLEKGLGNLKSYENQNSEAQKMRLAAKVNSLKKNIKKSEKGIKTLSKRLEKRIKDELEMMEKYGKVKTAGSYMNRIRDYFSVLEKTGGRYASQKKTVMKKAQKVYDKIMEKARNNKLPKNGYSDSGRSSLEKDIARAYKERYKSQPARVVITSNWKEEKIYKVQNNVITAQITRYVHAHVAVKRGSNYTVFIMTFGKKKAPGGKYGKLSVNSIGNNYPVMANNINK